MLKPISGGMLVQSRDNGAVLRAGCQVVTQRAPTDAEWADLMFAWTVARHVKSNAIVYANGGATAGVGAGQMSRLDSTRIAARKAIDAAEAAGWPQPRTIGSCVASDAFFPFADGLLAGLAYRRDRGRPAGICHADLVRRAGHPRRRRHSRQP